MENCTELARIILPWGGDLLNYCPVHANKIVMVANAMGSSIHAQLLPENSTRVCECKEQLTEEEKVLATTFKL